MNVPKFIRKWKYKKIIKELEEKPRGYIFLCHKCKYHFPFVSIKYYPELWNRKESADWYTIFDRIEPCKHAWFVSNETRKQYVEEALELVNN